MTNLQRRLTKLEALLTDPSGLVPQSQRWLEYWDRQIYDYAIDPEGRRPAVLFPLEAVRAVLQHADNPGSLFGSIPTKTSTPIKSLLGPESNYFTSWDDFKPPGANCLILALCNEYGLVLDHTPDGGVGHIVITEPRTLKKRSPPGPVTVEAVESTAAGSGGLLSNTYTITTMKLDGRKRAFFLVDRGPGMGPKLWFRITELVP